MSPSRNFVSYVSASLGGSIQAPVNFRLSSGIFVSCLKDSIHEYRGERTMKEGVHLGQLKKCVWAGCLYIIEEDRKMQNPLSPKLSGS